MVAHAAMNAPSSARPSPIMPPLSVQESMVQYFSRLKTAVDLNSYRSSDSIDQPGLWLYKRPVLSPSGGPSPLAVCGSVYHHCILFIKDAASGEVHSLDYGPANGADVTSSLMEAVPARSCLARNVSVQEILSASSGKQLPFMCLGRLAVALDHPDVQQALQHAESQRYHAVQNNCIHFADAMARLLTGGKVVSAPLLYDVLCGQVPAVDNPTVLMLQMMLQLSWISVCDGSRLYGNMLSGLCGPKQQDHQRQQQQVDASASAASHCKAADAAMESVRVLGKRDASTALLGSVSDASATTHQDRHHHHDNSTPAVTAITTQAAGQVTSSTPRNAEGVVSPQMGGSTTTMMKSSTTTVGAGPQLTAGNPAAALLQQLAQAAAGGQAAAGAQQAAATMAMRLLAAYAAQVPATTPATAVAAQTAGGAADSEDS